MSLSDFEKHFENYAKHEISMDKLNELKSFINLVHHLGLRKTKADARRLIAQKGFQLNCQVQEQDRAIDFESDLLFNKYLIVKAGKK